MYLECRPVTDLFDAFAGVGRSAGAWSCIVTTSGRLLWTH